MRHPRDAPGVTAPETSPGAAPLLDVDGVTLQYKTREHLVTATYRVELPGLAGGPLRAAGALGLRQIDAAQGGRAAS